MNKLTDDEKFSRFLEWLDRNSGKYILNPEDHGLLAKIPEGAHRKEIALRIVNGRSGISAVRFNRSQIKLVDRKDKDFFLIGCEV